MRSGTLSLLLAIGAATLGPLLFAGLPISFASSGQDSDAALVFLHGFATELAEGAWWPRWLGEGNRGFGSPAFLFYPPLAYWVAAGLQGALRLDAAGALWVAAMGWRVASALLAYLWLRRRLGRAAALAGAALFSLHVQNLLVNPLVGFPYSELAGTCALLLALMASEARRPLAWVPPAFALLVVTHLPTAVLAGGVLPAWGFVAGGMGRAGLRRAALVLAGSALGAALAAAYLVPALLLLPEIHAAGWDTGGMTTWHGHFLFDRWTPSKPVVHFLFMNAGLAVLLAALVAMALAGRRAAPLRRDRFFAGGAALLLVLCLMMTPLSWPVWWALPPLQKVQFPWRLMVPATALWAMLLAWRLERLQVAGSRAGWRIAVAAMLVSGAAALWLPYGAMTEHRPAFARYDWTRLHRAAGPRGIPRHEPPEYAPRAAAATGWRAEDPATDAPLHAALARSHAAAPGLALARAPNGALRIAGGSGAPTSLLLPRLAFPGWTMSGQPADAGLATDATTGLLRLDLPAGAVELLLHRVPTQAERIGVAASGGALLAWLLLLGLSRRPRRGSGR